MGQPCQGTGGVPDAPGSCRGHAEPESVAPRTRRSGRFPGGGSDHFLWFGEPGVAGSEDASPPHLSPDDGALAVRGPARLPLPARCVLGWCSPLARRGRRDDGGRGRRAFEPARRSLVLHAAADRGARPARLPEAPLRLAVGAGSGVLRGRGHRSAVRGRLPAAALLLPGGAPVLRDGALAAPAPQLAGDEEVPAPCGPRCGRADAGGATCRPGDGRPRGGLRGRAGNGGHGGQSPGGTRRTDGAAA